jgi:fumarate hydratase subunit beta
MIKSITLPMTYEEAKTLHSGECVLITGVLYTARDAAHSRLIDVINKGESLPIPIENQGIYYVGPSPTRPGNVIGACGPTTSYRMDDLTVPLLEKGLRVMIGKGERSEEVVEAMKRYGAVYLAATGGAGALLATTVKNVQVVAYEDLGAEAIHRLEVEKFPAVVVIDSFGVNAYDVQRKKYKRENGDGL